MSDYDPRLVDLYDEDNPDGPDHDFYRALADDIAAKSILDIGCGTGILTVTMAGRERTVVGIDPSASMLQFARRRPGSEGVSWVLGDSRSIPGAKTQGDGVMPPDGVRGRVGFDYAVMTGNVAQHIPDPQWERTLADLSEALRAGGVLAFEARNPRARAWRSWAAEPPTVRDTRHGLLREWREITHPEPGQVLIASHTIFEASGDHVVSELLLIFRQREAIEQQLHDAGFAVDAVWADWSRSAATPDTPLMVFQAHRA